MVVFLCGESDATIWSVECKHFILMDSSFVTQYVLSRATQIPNPYNEIDKHIALYSTILKCIHTLLKKRNVGLKAGQRTNGITVPGGTGHVIVRTKHFVLFIHYYFLFTYLFIFFSSWWCVLHLVSLTHDVNLSVIELQSCWFWLLVFHFYVYH